MQVKSFMKTALIFLLLLHAGDDVPATAREYPAGLWAVMRPRPTSPVPEQSTPASGDGGAEWKTHGFESRAWVQTPSLILMGQRGLERR